jgi:hypothetical protein
MPFKDEIFFANAKNHEVAGLTIKLGRITNMIVMALMKINTGQKVDEEIEKLRELAAELDELFNRLSGYTDG